MVISLQYISKADEFRKSTHQGFCPLLPLWPPRRVCMPLLSVMDADLASTPPTKHKQGGLKNG